MAKGRKTGGQDFRPGTSGNPGGRPRQLKEVQEAARARTAEAMDTLTHLMRHGKPDHVRAEACKILLERAWGKPSQLLEGGEPDRPVTVRLVWEDVGINADGE